MLGETKHEFETLKLEIRDDHGERVGVVELDDPREKVAENFNALGRAFGLEAHPIISATRLASSICFWAYSCVASILA